MVTIPEFADKSKKIEWLVANKSLLIASRKSEKKVADAFSGNASFILDDDKTVVTKAEQIPATVTKLKVRSIVNTTKLFDSCADVHIDQLWNRSIKETKDNYLVKSHDFDWDGIISDNVHVFTKQMSWHELGYNYEGQTQALIYDSILERDEMPDKTKSMFDAYRKGRVKQHSVSMKYRELFFAVNDERYAEEFAIWNKYFEEIANKEDVLDTGYFWAVTKAQHLEGSAVVRGSNFATPTYSVEAKTAVEAKSIPLTVEAKSIPKASELINLYTIKI